MHEPPGGCAEPRHQDRRRGQFGDLRHGTGVQRDHHERPVQPFQIGQPHAELIGRPVLGGVEHGELGLVLLQRGRYPERRLTAADQSPGDVPGHDQRGHDADDDDQQVAPTRRTERGQYPAEQRHGQRCHRDQAGVERRLRHDRHPGQVGGHRPRPAQQGAQRRFAQDGQQGQAGGDPHPDRVLRAAEQIAAGDRDHQQQPGCLAQAQQPSPPAHLAAQQPADDQQRGDREERADQAEDESVGGEQQHDGDHQADVQPVSDQQVDDLGLIRTGESRPRADAERPVRLIRLARLGSIHGEAKAIAGSRRFMGPADEKRPRRHRAVTMRQCLEPMVC